LTARRPCPPIAAATAPGPRNGAGAAAIHTAARLPDETVLSHRKALSSVLRALALRAGACTTVQAARCSSERDHCVVPGLRADIGCSAASGDFTGALCAEKIQERDNAWFGYADCVHFEHGMPRP